MPDLWKYPFANLFAAFLFPRLINVSILIVPNPLHNPYFIRENQTRKSGFARNPNKPVPPFPRNSQYPRTVAVRERKVPEGGTSERSRTHAKEATFLR